MSEEIIKTKYDKVFKALYYNTKNDYPLLAENFRRFILPEIHYAMHNSYRPDIGVAEWKRDAKAFIEAKLGSHEFVLVAEPGNTDVWVHHGDI